MAAAIKERFSVTPKLVPGRKSGVFDVEASGKLLFSKFEQGRFPETEEILAALAALT